MKEAALTAFADTAYLSSCTEYYLGHWRSRKNYITVFSFFVDLDSKGGTTLTLF